MALWRKGIPSPLGVEPLDYSWYTLSCIFPKLMEFCAIWTVITVIVLQLEQLSDTGDSGKPQFSLRCMARLSSHLCASANVLSLKNFN